jgi:asparagine synthase (glutamine-hydrolysing)
MAQALRAGPGGQVEKWSNAYAALLRVRNTSVDAGHQPLFSAGRRTCMFFFGECVAYEDRKKELIRLGHEFCNEQGDGEFVLRLYEQHGDAAFRMLSGSFCLAIYDVDDCSLRLVSDRLGSRPLFYGTTRDGRLSFATRVSPLLQDDGISRELDTAAVLEFCSLQKVLGFKTYHRGILMLPPGSMLYFRNGVMRLSRYWTPRYDPQPGSIGQYAEELAETIKIATSDVTRGPGRTGLLLSGGLDARMIAAAAEKPLTCYCFGDYENAEFAIAKRVAEVRGFDIRFLRRDQDHYSKILDSAVELGSGMHPFNHAHALGFCEEIAGETPVLTHGYGIEALFRGTTLPKRMKLLCGLPLGAQLDPSLSDDNLPQRYYRRAYCLLGRYSGLFRAGVAEGLEAHVEESARETISDAAPHCTNVFDKLLWSDVFARSRYTGYLFLLALRPHVIERSVLFDNRLIDLHLRTPLEWRADDRLWLKAMSLLHGGVARVVSANTGYTPDTPLWMVAARNTVKAATKGLPLLWRLGRAPAAAIAGPGLSPRSWPRFDWMIRNNARLRTMITETLSDPEALPPSIFQLDRISELLAEHLAARGHHRDVLFALLTFGRWHKKYGAH